MDLSEIRDALAASLQAYLLEKDETCLARAYELGRQALAADAGVLEMLRMEHQALAKALANAGASEPTLRAFRDAGDFMAEGLAPFEMTHRGHQEANASLRRMTELLTAEAERIAHVLHSETGQLICAAQLALTEVEHGPSPEKGIQKVKDLLAETVEQVRQLSHELWPTVLDDFGLVAALEFLGEGVAKRTGLAIHVEGRRDDRFPRAVERAVYRIVQEGLNNAIKHGKASQAEVRVYQADGALLCSIKDDGVGFDMDAVAEKKGERGLGLTGIRDRLALMGGTFQVHSVPGRETEVVVSIPLRR